MFKTITTICEPLAETALMQPLVAILENAKDSTGEPITTEEIPRVTDQLLTWLLQHPDLETRIQEHLDNIRFKIQ